MLIYLFVTVSYMCGSVFVCVCVCVWYWMLAIGNTFVNDNNGCMSSVNSIYPSFCFAHTLSEKQQKVNVSFSSNIKKWMQQNCYFVAAFDVKCQKSSN